PPRGGVHRRSASRGAAGLKMPEGDSIRRTASRLRALAGEVIAAEAPHPRAAVLRVAERIDGRRLERVEAVGKNLLLTFEGDLVLRSHLRMRGRWHVEPAGRAVAGLPWLVLRGRTRQAVLRHGPVLELGPPKLAALGPDIMADPPDLDGMLARFHSTDQERELGEALLDQRLVAGIGNVWRSEGLFLAALSPWVRLGEVSEDDLRRVLAETSAAMRSGSRRRLAYGRAPRPCVRCGTSLAVRRQGDDARTAYWCPTCQPLPSRERDRSEGGTQRVGA
ncbi:MAG: DNA glycosylase, partial [Actinomycetota bacterium]|nr:DNA glycosylase [Actinomycetota bacterium]